MEQGVIRASKMGSIEHLNIKGKVLKNCPMKRYTSMKVGGKVSFLIYPLDEDDLLKAIKVLKEEDVSYRFLGNGTNIIVHDRGIDMALIRITQIKGVKYIRDGDEVLCYVTGGTALKRLIKENARNGLSGLERLYFIPGTVGGGIKMNAGSFGSSISDCLEELRVLNADGTIMTLSIKALSFDYRTSGIGERDGILSATFRLKEGSRAAIQKEMDYVYKERVKNHPLEFPSSGSIFKAVDGRPAWEFIEKVGLRGFRIGDACIADKHTNFIVNLGHARAVDIKQLIDKIKKEVFEQLGVMLEEEVELWGFDG